MRLQLAGREMPPDAFAVVMATGIVAIDAHHQSFAHLDTAMTVMACAAFAVLVLDVAVRAATSSGMPFHHLRRPDTALRLFSFVAACAVLGAQFRHRPAVLWPLGAAALVAWIILVPLAIADVRDRPATDLREHAHGAWLLASVATAGLSITAADLGTIDPWAGWLVLSMIAWLVGALLYVATTWLIARCAVARLVPRDVTPDSWILMGAVAILTLAAAHVDTTLRDQGVFTGLMPAMDPIIAVLWIFATAWIPVLLAAEVWHFDRGNGTVGRARSWWSAVFPLGMYSAASQATSSQLQIAALHAVALIFFWAALGLFVMVCFGRFWGQARAVR